MCLEVVAIYANLCMNNKGLILHFKYMDAHEITFNCYTMDLIFQYLQG